MIFRQYYLACLSHASYLIGDEQSGRAVIVDPQRDISGYLADAQEFGLSIERVLETHFHADFLSGHLELAHATGAVISYGEVAQPEFAFEPLADGQILSLGEVTLQILATPGHTPESISIVVKENPNDDVPYGVLTGDTASKAWGLNDSGQIVGSSGTMNTTGTSPQFTRRRGVIFRTDC